MVTFISDSYGGSASDRQIIERSAIVQGNIFEKGDSLMADRGIMIQDLLAAQDVQVNTPHMLQGQSQLAPEIVIQDRRLASERIHVERVIGLAKTFKIIGGEFEWQKVPVGGKIIFVCFALCNFRPNIVPNHC